MRTHNADNERIKRTYMHWLREAEGYSEASIDQALAAIHRFEASTGYRPFKAFRIEQAISFKRRLAQSVNPRTGKPLSKSTLHSTLNAIAKFVHWLAGQPGYRSRISYSDADYFKLSEKDSRIARAVRDKRVPSLEQIEHVIKSMPSDSDIEKRNRALVAFAILTGARDGANASLRIKHVDLKAGTVFQDGREVRTKFGKIFTTWFFPVADDVRAIVEEWIRHLVENLLFGPDDPLFPATKVAQDSDRRFAAVGLDRKFWSNAQPIRTILKEAFEAVGLPPCNPHSFRNTLAQLGTRLCRSPEEMKAWSQNLGHEKVMTTLTSYGKVEPHRQGELINRMSGANDDRELPDDTEELLLEILRRHKA